MNANASASVNVNLNAKVQNYYKSKRSPDALKFHEELLNQSNPLKRLRNITHDVSPKTNKHMISKNNKLVESVDLFKYTDEIDES